MTIDGKQDYVDTGTIHEKVSYNKKLVENLAEFIFKNYNHKKFSIPLDQISKEFKNLQCFQKCDKELLGDYIQELHGDPLVIIKLVSDYLANDYVYAVIGQPNIPDDIVPVIGSYLGNKGLIPASDEQELHNLLGEDNVNNVNSSGHGNGYCVLL